MRILLAEDEATIAKATVEAHGGRISVKQTGNTICFQVVL